MNPIVLPRSSGVSFPLLIVVAAMQVALTLPAATSFERLDFFRQWIAPYLGFLGVVLFPLFDDDPTTRLATRAMYALCAVPCVAWALSNSFSPGETSVARVAGLALLLAIPVYAVIWGLESLAARVWDRYRQLADGARQWSYSLTIAASVSTVLLVVVVITRSHHYLTRPASKREIIHTAERHGRQIIDAMRKYRAMHGSFPYHDRGAGYALYRLRGVADISSFNAIPRKTPLERAEWDDRLERLANSDFLYLNERGFVPSESVQRVVLMAKVGAFPGWALLGTPDGQVLWHETSAPGASLLGNWVSPDGFLFTDPEVLGDWVKSHNLPYAVGSNGSGPRQQNGSKRPFGSPEREFDPHHRLTRVAGNGVIIEYQYTRNRLTGCNVYCPAGTIRESVSTDEFGRIIGIARSPEDWKDLVPTGR